MNSKLEQRLMAVLFAVGDPISPAKIAAAFDISAEAVRETLEKLKDKLDRQKSALQILYLGGQYQLVTRTEYTADIQKVLTERRNVPLTQSALEVLAAIAYNQPVTRGYVEQVRGVDSNGIVANLVEKGLIEEAGRLELPGRPIAYKTTAHFLRTFGLSSLDELPLTASEEIVDDIPDDITFSDDDSLM